MDSATVDIYYCCCSASTPFSSGSSTSNFLWKPHLPSSHEGPDIIPQLQMQTSNHFLSHQCPVHAQPQGLTQRGSSDLTSPMRSNSWTFHGMLTKSSFLPLSLLNSWGVSLKLLETSWRGPAWEWSLFLKENNWEMQKWVTASWGTSFENSPGSRCIWSISQLSWIPWLCKLIYFIISSNSSSSILLKLVCFSFDHLQ